ncbi:MAG: SH3 domain-containing protein [Pseudomonadota bacterium]
MKRYTFLLGCLLILLTVAMTQAGPKKMSVQIKEGQIRNRASFLGQVKAQVIYGDQVDVLGEQGDWVQVRSSDGKDGWLHRSALSEKKIILRAGQTDARVAATGEEATLAGKGFNEEVEKEYRTRNPGLNYAWVDRMERIEVGQEEKLAFLNEGEMASVKGGAR